MPIIPLDTRKVLGPGGSDLPGGSFLKVQAAGATGRGLTQAGNALANIGLRAQKASDNAELGSETVAAESALNTELAKIKQQAQDPDEYRAQADKALKTVIENSAGRVNHRNKAKFQAVLGRLQINGNRAIAKEQIGKAVDKSKAFHILLKDTVAQDVATGKLTQAEGVAIVRQNTDDMLSNGVLDQVGKVNDDRAFSGRIAEVAFEAKFPIDPEGAIRDLNQNKNVPIEVKQNLIDKETRKFNLFDKKRKEAQRLDRDVRVKTLKLKGRSGDLTEEDLIRDQIEHPDNPMSVDNFTSLLNDVNKVQVAGGVGNPEVFNDVITDIRQHPDLFSADDLYKIQDQAGLNAEQSNEMDATFEKLVTGKSDPNDITTFRVFKEGMKFNNLFAPSKSDTGDQLGIKKLRFNHSYSFARGKAIELYKTNKNVDSVMAQVETETYKEMDTYNRLIQGFIDDGTLDRDETSVFKIKKLTEPILKEREELRNIKPGAGAGLSQVTFSPLDIEEDKGKDTGQAERDREIDAIFDKAEREGREVTEAEIAKMNELRDGSK